MKMKFCLYRNIGYKNMSWVIYLLYTRTLMPMGSLLWILRLSYTQVDHMEV